MARQPKFVSCGPALNDRLPEGEIEPAALLAALERPETGDRYVCHAIEFAGCREPDQTTLAQCSEYLSDHDSQSEFWLIADNEECARSHYEAFHGIDVACRFDCIDPDKEPALDSGLLRPAGAEILFLHGGEQMPDPSKWKLLRRLAVPGGLALVSHDVRETVEPAVGWNVVRAGRCATLLQASQVFEDDMKPSGVTDGYWRRTIV